MSLAQSLSGTLVDQNWVMAEAKKAASEIRRRCSPLRIILFGSAAESRFRTGSDFDFILVFEDLPTMQSARKNLRKRGKIHTTIPIDLIFMTIDGFESSKTKGGLCYVAIREGVEF